MEGNQTTFDCSDIVTENQVVEFSRNRTIYEKSRLENNQTLNIIINNNMLTIKNISNIKV